MIWTRHAVLQYNWQGAETMPRTQYTSQEIVQRGQALYEQEIRPKVEAENKGKYLIINVATGDYEMDADDLAASKRAKARFPDAPLFTMRIGYPTAYRLGGRFLVKQP
jgi:hypothetical protein